MRKFIVQGWRHTGERGIVALFALLALLLIPLAGCSPQGMAQSAAATANTQATQIANPSPTVILPVGEVQARASITATAAITSTAVITGVQTPTGAPADPASRLNIFEFFSPNDTLVTRDFINLDGEGTDEVLYTIAGRPSVITGTEVQSGIGVLIYDATAQRWDPVWASPPLSGTTSPLPSANRKEAGGYNGGILLSNTGPVLVVRSTTSDGKAHLQLWRWNSTTKEGEALKMVPPEGGSERDAVFDADLDVNIVDINDDGIYEVVLDNLIGVQIWTWDGTRFVLRGDR